MDNDIIHGMNSFTPGFIERQPITQNLLRTVFAIGELKGKEGLFKAQSPQALETLRQAAVIQSTESSNHDHRCGWSPPGPISVRRFRASLPECQPSNYESRAGGTAKGWLHPLPDCRSEGCLGKNIIIAGKHDHLVDMIMFRKNLKGAQCAHVIYKFFIYSML